MEHSKQASEVASKQASEMTWEELSRHWGYEGAAAVIVNCREQILMLGDGKAFQIPGGKPEAVDKGDPIATVIREVKEECGLELRPVHFVNSTETTGGSTGIPSKQFITFPLDGLQPKPLEKFTEVAWVRLSRKDGKWVALDGDRVVPIRGFNQYFLNQNPDFIKRFVDV